MNDQVGKITFCFNLKLYNVNLNRYVRFSYANLEDLRGKFKFNQNNCCNTSSQMFSEWSKNGL